MKNLSWFLLVILFLSSCVTNQISNWFTPSGFPLEKKTFLIGINFPYYSLFPHVNEKNQDYSYWLNALEEVKALGFNSLYINIPWGFHEEKIGSPEFVEGAKGIRVLLQLLSNTNLKVIMNLSPQSIDEFNGGGLPLWLQRYLSFSPSKEADQRIAVRSNDYEFLRLYEEYIHSLVNISFPFFWSLKNREAPIAGIILEKDLIRLNALWDTTLSYLNIFTDPLYNYTRDLEDIIHNNNLQLPIFYIRDLKLNTVINHGDAIRGNRALFSTQGEFKPLFIYILKPEDPYEILNAYVSGAAGVMLNIFERNFPDDWQGWKRGHYPDKASNVTITPPVEKNVFSPFQKPSTFATEISLITKWITKGYFPRQCQIMKWETSIYNKNYTGWEYFLHPVTATVTRYWRCKDGNMEIYFSDPDSLVVKIIGGNFPYTIFHNCRLLFGGKKDSTIYFIAEDFPDCYIETKGKISYLPPATKTTLSTRFFHQREEIISSNGKDGKIVIFVYPVNEIAGVNIVPAEGIIMEGGDYILDIKGKLKIVNTKPVTLKEPTSSFSTPVSEISYSSSTSDITIQKVFYFNETPYNESYNPTENGGQWIAGKAFSSYFSDSPYNYVRGVFWVEIPFKNSYSGNGVIKLPGLNGLYNVLLNGNYLETVFSYGKDVYIHFKKTQIKTTSTNYLTLMGFPVGTFPFNDPFYLEVKEHSTFYTLTSYLTLFNFYRKIGTIGDATVTVGEKTFSLSGKWFFVNKLWGERNGLYKSYVNSLWTQRSLPIHIPEGKIIWIKFKLSKLPDPLITPYKINITVEGKDIFVRAYFDERLVGNLIPGKIATRGLRILPNSDQLTILPDGNYEKYFSFAVISTGSGILKKINVEITPREKTSWISLH